MCGVFSEMAPLQRSTTRSVESHMYGSHFPVESTHAYIEYLPCSGAEGSALQCIHYKGRHGYYVHLTSQFMYTSLCSLS